MTPQQQRVFENLQARCIRKTCSIKTAIITKAETENYGKYVMFTIAAEVGIFHGCIIGSIGPRGGVEVTHERYDFY